MHRGEIYEDPLHERVAAAAPGSEVVGGGSEFDPEDGVLSCDIEVEIVGSEDDAERLVGEALDAIGVPRGSWFEVAGRDRRPIGSRVAVSLALDGAALTAEAAAENDVNVLIDSLLADLGEVGRLESWWEGPHWTTLFFTGPDEAALRAVLESAPHRSPLATGSRVVTIS